MQLIIFWEYMRRKCQDHLMGSHQINVDSFVPGRHWTTDSINPALQGPDIPQGCNKSTLYFLRILLSIF